MTYDPKTDTSPEAVEREAVDQLLFEEIMHTAGWYGTADSVRTGDLDFEEREGLALFTRFMNDPDAARDKARQARKSVTPPDALPDSGERGE